jgi:hypothetical protein
MRTLKMRPLQLSQLGHSFFKEGIFFGHLLGQFSLEEFDVIDVMVVNLAF